MLCLFPFPQVSLPLFLVALLACLPALNASEAPPRTLLFYGDSLTAGYGLDDPSTQAFPALIQQKIDAAHLPWRVVNAGLSGDTTSGGLRRLDWVLRGPVDLFVLELGANDGLRGLSLDLIRNNLQAIGDRLKNRRPDARLILAGMRMPDNMGDYAAAFDRIFPELAAANDWPLIPFLLDGVGGVPDMNLADGIHPNPAGHDRIAATLWPFLEPFLRAP